MTTKSASTRVLLIEDEPDYVDLLEKRLAAATAPFEVESASSLAAGIEKIQQTAFDAVVLDLDLPDSRGSDTVTRLHNAAPGLALVVLSGSDDKTTICDCLHCGAQEYLTKDVATLNLLPRTIDHAIERKRAELELIETDEKLRTIIEHSDEVFYFHDTEHCLHYVSPRSMDILGYAPEEMMVKWTTLTTDNPINDAGFRLTNEAIKSGKRQPPYSLEVRRKDGEIRLIQVNESPVKDEAGQVVGIAGALRDITERKRADEALRRERDRAQAYLDIAEVVLIAITAEGKVTLVNRKGCELLGYDESEIVGNDWFDKFLPDRLRENVRGVSRQIVAGDIESVRDYENPVLTKSGEERIVAWHTCELRDECGVIVGHLSSGEDVTEARQAQHALRASEAQYRAVVESTADAVILFDGETRRFLDVNDAACRMYGYSREEFLGLRHSDITAEPEKSDASIRDALDGASKRIPVRYHRKKDGATFPVEVSGSAFTVGDRNTLCGIVRDITDRKAAEVALTHSHDLMSYIIDNSQSCIAVHDRDLKYLYVSQRYLRDYRVEERDVIGKHHYDVFPDLPQKWRDVHQKALAGEISSAENDPYVREDGSVDWTRWECRPWYEADGSVGGIIVYTEIITERKRMESRMAEISANEREKLRRDLHDTVCQRLAGARLLADHLREDLAESPEGAAERIDEISRLIRQSLDEAHLLGGQMERLPDAPGALGEALVDLASRIANLHNVRCRVTSRKRVSLRDGLISSQLLLIAQEAATNAARHARASSIGISLSRRGRVIKLKVRDDGKGMPGKKEQRGGMGIKIMHERADLIGGKLVIHQPAEGGTVVECTWKSGTGSVKGSVEGYESGGPILPSRSLTER